jgi:hypothetical protein
MEIKHEATKQLIVHHLYKLSPEQLMRLSLSSGHGPRPLFWHNGILFFFNIMPNIMNPEITSEFVKGIEHWEEVCYAEHDKFKETIEIEDGEYKGAKLHVLKADGFTPHKEFAEWASKKK